MFDAYDAKAEALAILAAAGAPVDNLQVLDGATAVYHPGQAGRLGLGPKTILAEFGALHPRIARAFDLDGPVMAAELFLDAIPAKRSGVGHMRAAYAPPPLQAVTRDFAFIVPDDLPAEQLRRAVRGADRAAIADARIFDVFTGESVGAGAKSLAIEVVLQPTERSFDEAALKEISDRIVAAAEKLGARLRG
jgi:phenylalanyl-tRNA synthetase beta chain